MTPLAQALNAALLHFVWQGIVVGLLLWLALFLLRRSSARARYLASCVAFTLLALAPIVTAWNAYAPQVEARVPWMTTTSVESQSLGRLVPEPAVIVPGLHNLEGWILPAWALGVALFALRLMGCWGHTSALRRTGTPADGAFVAMVLKTAQRVGVTRRIRVLMSSVTDVPSVIGWARPVLLLPVAVATGLTPEQLEALMAHELAHIRRHDYLVNLAQTVVETVLFYHPVVWWVSSKIRYERELCCDDLAVVALGDATCYARALARLEEVRDPRPSLAMGAARGPLFRRIERLLGGDGLQAGPSRLACAIGLLVGLACLALNMSWAQGRQSRESDAGTIAAEAFFPPLPPVPPVPVLPAFPPLPSLPPIPPTPPLPPVASVFPSVSSIVMEALQRAVQGTEAVPWVLFRGERVMSSGSSADETEARAARQSAGGGDALWFRLDGKAYLTQDQAILDRLAQSTSPTEPLVLGAQEFLAEQQLKVAEELKEFQTQQRSLQEELQANLAAIQADLPKVNNSLDALSPARMELDKLRRDLDVLTAKLHQQELAQLQSNIAAQRGAALRDKMEQSLRLPAPVPDLLRDAVSSGKARPVQ